MPERSFDSVRLPGLWFWLSSAAALLAAAGAVVGLLATDGIYGKETAALADAAAAQEIVDLVIVAPVLGLLAWCAQRGCLQAYISWLGCLAFFVYNFAIFAFSIHFGPLFLVWVAVLGMSIFSLAGGLSALDTGAVKAHFSHRPMTLPGWFLMVVATAFALLWLSEIVPDLIAGDPSSSGSDWKIPTNPVHVLDLAFFLPATFVSGLLLLRRHPLGYATAVGQLVWLALTCLPILLTPFVADARGHEPGWAVMIPIGIMLFASLAVLVQLLRRSSPDQSGGDESESPR